MKREIRLHSGGGILLIRLALILAITSLFAVPAWCNSAKQARQDDLLSVSFPSAQSGWACGRWGTILHTADGGASWAAQVSGTDNTLISIFFFDDSNGWAVGSNGIILHTEDGGIEWKAQKSPVDFLLRGVCFVSPGKGWIATERTHILYTENAGKTWRVQFQDEDFVLKSIDFCDDRHGWAVGEFGYIFYTDNGGQSWRRQAGKYELNEAGELIGSPSLFDVVAIDPSRAIAVGMDGCIMRTTDRGASWESVDAGAPIAPLFCIAANPRGKIVIGGKGTCLYSPNRGLEWKVSKLQSYIKYSWIYGLAHRGDNAGFITTGEQGAVYAGTAADRWQRVYY